MHTILNHQGQVRASLSLSRNSLVANSAYIFFEMVNIWLWGNYREDLLKHQENTRSWIWHFLWQQDRQDMVVTLRSISELIRMNEEIMAESFRDWRRLWSQLLAEGILTASKATLYESRNLESILGSWKDSHHAAGGEWDWRLWLQHQPRRALVQGICIRTCRFFILRFDRWKPDLFTEIWESEGALPRNNGTKSTQKSCRLMGKNLVLRF